MNHNTIASDINPVELQRAPLAISLKESSPWESARRIYDMFRMLLLLCLALPALASEERAREIIDEMEQLYRGESSDATMTMQVQTPNYDRTMTLSGQSFGKDYGFFRILGPKKDRGIATLKRDEEMWNYFPKINKVIKVPPSMMMGSWMGSDFTNDDLVKETQLIDTYSLDLIETDDQYKVILTPKEQTVTVWDKIEYIISKDPLLPLSQAFFDEDGNKIRELTFHEPREFDGKLMPSILEMRPLNKEGHLTRIIYDDIKFNVPDITEDTFSLRHLKSRF
jgi:outer membrane lipoprotein-sorting protein